LALATFNMKQWIDEHRHLLKPPVGNACVWKDRDFIIMVVGGPNARKDYHVNEGEEFFFQLEGDITLKIVEDGAFRDVRIREGDIFLLPARVPHSPQRPANTVGLVVERQRRLGEDDGFVWFCERCGHELHRATFFVTDIATQLKPIFDAFWADPAKRTCKRCGAVMEKPGPAKG
jgi:3-hydroxyanthranilate 3,4-dioxygenase